MTTFSGPKAIDIKIALLFTAIGLATYSQCITLPFIQDDWGLIRAFQAQETSALLVNYLTPANKFFFRPLGQVYLLAIFRLFGMLPAIFHTFALCIHILNSYLVFSIFRHLTRDLTLSVVTGAIYTAAVAVHLDPLCWAVGIYDLGGALFFLLSILLFLRQKFCLSAFSFLCATLFKESTLVLPGILVAVEIIRVPTWRKKDIYHSAKALIPHVIVIPAILACKLMSGRSPLFLPESHPYVITLQVQPILTNTHKYGVWMLQSILPFDTPQSRLFCIVLFGLVILSLIYLFNRRARAFRRVMLGFMLWVILALLPVLFLPNHSFRYYATYALPAFIFGVLFLVQHTVNCAGLARWRPFILVLIGSFAALTSMIQSNRIFGQGLQPRTLLDGSGCLIRRAQFVKITQESLLRQLPRPTTSCVVFLDGVDLWSFNKDAGIQAWYDSGNLRIYDLADLRWNEENFFIQSPTETQEESYMGAKATRVPLTANSVHGYRLLNPDMGLQELTKSELVDIARTQSHAGL